MHPDPPDEPDPGQTRGNAPRPEDGPQDVTQDPADVPDDSPTGGSW